MGKKLEAPPEHPNTRKLLGTFTAPSGLAIGEPYADRRIADPRHKGKGLEAGVWRSVLGWRSDFSLPAPGPSRAPSSYPPRAACVR